MRWAQAGGLAATLIAAASLAGGASAKTQPGTTYVDQADGFAITIPTAWKIVPRGKAALKATIAKLKKSKSNAELVATFSSLLASKTGVSDLTAYKLQALAWPPDTNTPILTQVEVGVVPTKTAYGTSDLPAIGATYANALSANKGSKIVVPKVVKLPPATPSSSRERSRPEAASTTASSST